MPASEVTLATVQENVTKPTLPNASVLTPILKNEYFQEFFAGTVAAGAISHAMTIIDMGIIRAQFRKVGLGSAMMDLTKELVTGQAKWNPALNIMFKVYGATYLTANITDVACRDMGIEPSTPTAVLTTLVNCGMIAWKDKKYSEFYNTKNMDNFPKISYGLFFLRDALTIISSFNLKHQFRHYLQDEHGMPHLQAELTASFATPMFAQLFSTPLHILALDIFDNPNASVGARMAAIKKSYMSVCTGRVLRIIPAFGIGGYINDIACEKLIGHELH